MDNNKEKPYSIIRRLIIGLTVVLGIVLIIASLLIAMIGAREGRIDLENEADKSIAHLMRILEKPLWDMDGKRTAITGEAYSMDARIIMLTITGSVNQILYSIDRGDLSDSIQRSGKIVRNGKVLGEVKIAFSPKIYHAKIRQVFLATIVINILLLVTVFSTTGILIRNLLRRPLDQLTEIVNSYASEDYTPIAADIPHIEFRPFGRVLGLMGEKILG